MRKLFFVLTGLAMLVATPALAADSDTCVRRNDIRSWVSPQKKQLILENYARHKVLLKMNGDCEGFGTYDSFTITGTVTGAASCVLPGDEIHTSWAGEPGRCGILSVEPYTGEMPVHH